MSPEQMLERLSGRLDLLKGGRDADPRQQTLRATIEWSHDLLSPHEQVLFRRLAVFAGGASLEGAEAVVGADVDVLQSLVDKRPGPVGRPLPHAGDDPRIRRRAPGGFRRRGRVP